MPLSPHPQQMSEPSIAVMTTDLVLTVLATLQQRRGRHAEACWHTAQPYCRLALEHCAIESTLFPGDVNFSLQSFTTVVCLDQCGWPWVHLLSAMSPPQHARSSPHTRTLLWCRAPAVTASWTRTPGPTGALRLCRPATTGSCRDLCRGARDAKAGPVGRASAEGSHSVGHIQH